ncbi:MAG: hypothetical protein RIR00_1400 [Pseudomonadota bacterium]
MFRLPLLLAALALPLAPVVAAPATSAPPSCASMVETGFWGSMLNAGERTQQAYLRQLAGCLRDEPPLRTQADALLAATLAQLPGLPAARRLEVARFALLTLLPVAQSGHAPAQQRLATLFNPAPGSVEATLFAQDLSQFAFWTRMAALQGNPQALFNLASRMVNGAPEAGIVRDRELAYQLLLLLEGRPGLATQPGGAELLKFSQTLRGKLATALGAAKVGELQAGLDQFEVSRLLPAASNAPAGAFRLVPVAWSRQDNLDRAVQAFLQLHAQQGSDAVMAELERCYREHSGNAGLTQGLEYCLAFDTAAVEYLSLSYERLARKYPGSKSSPPLESQRGNGQRRMVRQLLAAGVKAAEPTARALHEMTVQRLAQALAQRPGGGGLPGG